MFFDLPFTESPLFAELRRLQQDVDDLFGTATPWAGGIRSLPPGTFPAINVGSTAENVTVYLFAPGIDPKSLDISLQQNVLSVSGERSVSTEENATYYRQERFSGTFRRVIALPEDVDADKVEASYRDGIVQIRVQRHESAKPRQIEVH
jgi:HSP20 family protein